MGDTAAAEKKRLNQRLDRLLRMLYLTAEGIARIVGAHASAHRDSVRERIAQHAQAWHARARAASELMDRRRLRLPLQRVVWKLIARGWGWITARAGATFSLHMLANLEQESIKIAKAVADTGRDLALLTVVETSVRLTREGEERKAWLVEQLKQTDRAKAYQRARDEAGR